MLRNLRLTSIWCLVMAKSGDNKRISVLGDGAWGTTIALLLKKNGFEPLVWGHDSSYIEEVKAKGENFRYLPGFSTKGIVFSSDLKDAFSFSDIIILAVPSRFAGNLIRRLSKSDFATGKKWCIATKGMDFSSKQPFSEIIREFVSPKAVAVISGPAIAKEVAKGLPTVLVCAGRPVGFAVFLRNAFSSRSLRVYSSNDVLGVELGGALKNVIAIAAGMCDGLGLGVNAKSALITRGLSEMARLACKMGAKKKTLYGASGIGDLMTTCFSPSSRNRSFGQAIAQGNDPKLLLNNSITAIEGAYTSRIVVSLAKKYEIELPISKQVYNIIFRGADINKAIVSLLSRPLKHED